MRFPTLRDARLTGLAGLLAAGILTGFLLLPALIYLAGSSVLGRYEGASMGNLYGSIYRGLAHGSMTSWIVVLGPAALILLGRGLKPLWNAGKDPAD
jgi:hypothetical protein